MNVYRYCSRHHPTGRGFIRECVAPTELAFMQQLSMWTRSNPAVWSYWAPVMSLVRVATPADLAKIERRQGLSYETAWQLPCNPPT